MSSHHRELPGVGSSTPRREDARLVTGRGTFVSSLRLPDMLHAVFVRSYVAHAEVRSIDVSAAQGMPGVVAVLTAADLDLGDIPGRTGPGPDAPAMTRPPLVRDRVRYVGEPLAVVVATTPELATDAVEAVDVDLEPLPVAADVDVALEDTSPLFPAAGTNVVARQETETSGAEPKDGAAASGAEVEVQIVVDNQRLAPVTLESLSFVAAPGDDGHVTVWCGHQAPHRLRRQLANLLKFAPEVVHVRVPDAGGSYGLRGRLFPEYLVVTAAAVRLGRPIAWTQTRAEQFTGGTHGRGMRHRMRLRGDRAGRVRALDVDILADMGAYPHNGSQVPGFARLMATGAYDIQQVTTRTTLVVTNTAPMGSYRGAGRPEAAFAIERVMDAYAAAIGLDPVEVRRRNLIRPEQLPYRTATGALYDSGDYAAALELALGLVDVESVRTRQADARRAGGPYLGLGVAVFVERAGGPVDSGEYARVSLTVDGRVEVRAGSASTGQGHETVWAQLAAAALGVTEDRVSVITGDVDEVADGVGSFGSRSAQTAGSAVHRTATALRERIARLAADELEVRPSDVVVDQDGCHVRGDPSARVEITELVRLAEEQQLELAEEEMFTPGAQTFPYGAVAAVVEVDVGTGEVDLQHLVAVDDVGTVIHPQIVEGQVHGSLTQGLGQALYEEMTYDQDGQPITASLGAYQVPRAPDMPTITTDRLVTPAPSNPLGAKGSGESGCIGAPPAIVAAVEDALAPFGVRGLAMPLTPARIWQAVSAGDDATLG